MYHWEKIKLYLDNFLKIKEKTPIFIGSLPYHDTVIKRIWNFNILFLILTIFFALWVFLTSASSEVKDVMVKDEKRGLAEFSYDTRGFGPLRLNQRCDLDPFTELSHQLLVLGYNQRPDVKEEERTLLLCLEDSLEKRLVSNGEKIFLFEDRDKKFHFSFAPSELSIVPLIKNRDLIEIQVGDKGHFFSVPIFKAAGTEKAEFIEILKRAKVLGKDLLLQNYGGKEYQILAKKHKIDLGSEVLFVEEGDFLCWKEKEWSVLKKNESSQFMPIAEVKTINSQGIEIEIWNENGFNILTLNLGMQQSTKIGYKGEDLFSKVKIKSPSEISCLLGKRRVFLRQGDWWLKTEIGWRKLKSLQDIDDYLNHRVKGDLFILDKLEVIKEKAILKGKIFDSTRTQMVPLLVQTTVDKKGALSEKQKNKKVGRK